jgi:ribosome-interacting GTPase 1
MPTNLPPDYFEVEKRFRAAGSTAEKIACLEEMLSIVPKHKGTDHLRADLRRRLSKLKAAPKVRRATKAQDAAFHIDREGAGQVAIVGTANVGKSALVAALTNARPEVTEQPYATWTPVPGMMSVENVQIQLIDTPSLNPDYVEPALMDLIRRADLILLLVDLQAYPIEQIEEALALLEEHRIVPQHRRERYAEWQRLSFIPTQVVVNKVDDERLDEDFDVLCELLKDYGSEDQPLPIEWSGEACPLLAISVVNGRNMDRFRRVVYERLDIMRIYAKPPGREADLNEPFVMKRGSTVEEFAGQIHQDFLEGLKSARVWGSATFDGQMVGRDYVLHDGDVVELRT